MLSNTKISLNTDGSITIDNTNEKKLKEYQFDSLVYRYLRARERQAFYEYLNNKNTNRSRESYEKEAQRDIMRFIEILNEVMGDHS